MPDSRPEKGASTEYERYIRTDELRTLQLSPEELVHPEEFVFQATHQAIEVELEIGRHFLVEAEAAMATGAPEEAARLLRRAGELVTVVAALLEQLRHMTPAEFAVIRVALGSGTGGQSPGWREFRRQAVLVERALVAELESRSLSLDELYATSDFAGLRGVAEALIELDDRVRAWNARHYQVATRMLGETGVGTGGMQISELQMRTQRKLFPELWEARMSSDRVSVGQPG